MDTAIRPCHARSLYGGPPRHVRLAEHPAFRVHCLQLQPRQQEPLVAGVVTHTNCRVRGSDAVCKCNDGVVKILQSVEELKQSLLAATMELKVSKEELQNKELSIAKLADLLCGHDHAIAKLDAWDQVQELVLLAKVGEAGMRGGQGAGQRVRPGAVACAPRQAGGAGMPAGQGAGRRARPEVQQLMLLSKQAAPAHRPPPALVTSSVTDLDCSLVSSPTDPFFHLVTSSDRQRYSGKLGGGSLAPLAKQQCSANAVLDMLAGKRPLPPRAGFAVRHGGGNAAEECPSRPTLVYALDVLPVGGGRGGRMEWMDWEWVDTQTECRRKWPNEQ